MSLAWEETPNVKPLIYFQKTITEPGSALTSFITSENAEPMTVTIWENSV